MNGVLVSIIIPVYNVEKYIGRTIKSLQNQDYNNIEIIVVDDGSPDKSPEIIDSIAQNDCRIKVIHKENGGVSSARNAGLNIAQGDYVTFVDGDDWVDEDYVSYFLSAAEKYHSEIVLNKNNYREGHWKTKDRCTEIQSEQVIEWIYLGKIFVAVWNKMYKTSFLKEHNLHFDESIWYGEGMLFNIDCLQFIDKVTVCEKSVYHQTPNPNSAMRKFNLESNLCGIKSLEIQREHWKKNSKKIEQAWEYHRRAFNWSIMGGLARSGMEDKYRDIYNECASNLKMDLWKTIRVDITIKEKIFYILLALNPYFMANREKERIYNESKKANGFDNCSNL
jgi:glycosyltransferase involved in cell wall biosynthesis